MTASDAPLGCRACPGERLEVLLDLGPQPVAHRLPATAAEVRSQPRFPLVLHLCTDCGLPQIVDPIDPARLYGDYNFCFSSWKPQPHVPSEVAWLREALPGGRILELGSNDGLFLSALREGGFEELLGVEPNPHAAARSRESGHRVIESFFDERMARELREAEGTFDLVASRQVLEHIPDLSSFLGGAFELLVPGGHLFLEVPDVTEPLTHGDISCLWEEHVNYFTAATLERLLEARGFEPLRSRTYDFSGGSLAVLARRLAGPLDHVPPCEPGELELARGFPSRIGRYRDSLLDLLERAREASMPVVIYGVGCRACAIVNFLGLGSWIDFAVDDQPERQGLRMPGSGLEIRPAESLAGLEGPLLCLLAVNNESEPAVRRRLADIRNGSPSTFALSVLGPRPPAEGLAELLADELHFPSPVPGS